MSTAHSSNPSHVTQEPPDGPARSRQASFAETVSRVKMNKTKTGWEERKAINRRKKARRGRRGRAPGRAEAARGGTELVRGERQLQKVLLHPQELHELQRGFSPCFPFSPLWAGREVALRMQWQGLVGLVLFFPFLNFPYK